MKKLTIRLTNPMTKKIGKALLASCLAFAPLTADAQLLQASRSHYSTEDGLASNAISYLTQDDYGYLWIATWNGLSRFDGYDFYNYKTGNSSRIKNLHNRIFDLAVDQGQNVWMRMYDSRVFVIDRTTDRIINPFEGYAGYEEFKSSEPLLVTSTGDVLASINGSGLYILRLDRNGIKSDQVSTSGLTISGMAEGYQSDIWLGTNKGIHRLDRGNLMLEQAAILPDEEISCLHSNGYNIYAATSKGAIYVYAYGQQPKLVRHPSGLSIFSLFVDSQGVIWFCDDRMGASRLIPSTGDEKLFQQTVLVPEHDGRGGLFNENNGAVWVQMNHGGYGYYNREKDNVEYFHNDPTNPWNLSNTVNAALELPEGVVFESTTRRGLEKLEILKNNIVRERPVANATSTVENEIRAMYYDTHRKLLLLGNKSSSLFLYHDDGTRTTITHDDKGFPLGRLYGISKDSKGNYWLCSKDNGVFKMSPNGSGWSVRNYRHEADNKWSLSSNNAYYAIEDKEGNIWVATYGGGVNLMAKSKNGQDIFLHYGNEMKNYPHNSYRKMRTLELDKDGNVWAGSTDGILIMSYKNKKLSIEKLAMSDSEEHMMMSNDVVCLKRDKQGNMWAGTSGGGLSCTTGQDDDGNWLFKTYDSQSGLPSEEIQSITFGKDGDTWFATDHILCSFDAEKQIISTFSNLDGVDETRLSEGAAITLPNGNILFGTLDGYYIVDRKKLMTTTGSLLKLHLTGFYLDGELQSPRLNDTYDYYVPVSRSVKLPSRSSTFAFRFASLNYQLQHRVHYQYKLEGYDKDWQNAPNNRIANYSGVPAGTYTLKVRAFLLESPDKYDQRTIEIVVPPYAFLTSPFLWAYLAAGVILLVVLLIIWQRRVRRKRAAKRQAQEAEEAADEEEGVTEDYEVIDVSDIEEE